MPTDTCTGLHWPVPQHLVKGSCARQEGPGAAVAVGASPFLEARRAFQLCSRFVLQEQANVHLLTGRFRLNKTESGIPALISQNLREIYVRTVSCL